MLDRNGKDLSFIGEFVMTDKHGKELHIGDYVRHVNNNCIGKIRGEVNEISFPPSSKVMVFINTTQPYSVFWCKNVELLSDEEAMLWMLEN